MHVIFVFQTYYINTDSWAKETNCHFPGVFIPMM